MKAEAQAVEARMTNRGFFMGTASGCISYYSMTLRV
jgi:hypothetical protein